MVKHALFLFMDIKINGLTWGIVYTHNAIDLARSDGTAALGVTDKAIGKIFLYAGLRGGMLKKVLQHELTHAWAFSYGIYMTMEEEEFLCCFMDTYAEDIINTSYDILGYDKKDIAI